MPHTSQKHSILPAVLLLGLFACTSLRSSQAVADTQLRHDGLNQQSVMATLWQQQSAEAMALYHQAFNLAHRVLADDLATAGTGSRAVVVDIDETVLDNSPYQVRNILDGTAYPTGWKPWCNEAQAQALPGALDFLNWADAQGVHIYYVSNRKLGVLDASMKNLQRAGFPQVSKESCLFRDKDRSKEGRRSQIQQNQRIVLLMGDNLSDFSEAFAGQSSHERRAAVEKFSAEFGDRFIVLPNPMYGNWEGVLAEDYFKRDDQGRMKARIGALRRD